MPGAIKEEVKQPVKPVATKPAEVKKFNWKPILICVSVIGAFLIFKKFIPKKVELPTN